MDFVGTEIPRNPLFQFAAQEQQQKMEHGQNYWIYYHHHLSVDAFWFDSNVDISHPIGNLRYTYLHDRG